MPLKSFEGTVDSASVSERLETCNRDKEQGDERSTTLWCARASGRVTDEQRNEAKAAQRGEGSARCVGSDSAEDGGEPRH